jgi:hypothetical protein
MKFSYQHLTILSVLVFFIGCSENSDKSPKVTTNGAETNISIDDDNISEENSSKPETNISNPDNGTTIVDDENVNIGSGEIDMVFNRVYKIEKGDQIFEIDSARVKIVKNSEEGFFEATLISGRAKIFRKGSF